MELAYIKPQSGAHPQFFTSRSTQKRCTPGHVRLHRVPATLVLCRELSGPAVRKNCGWVGCDFSLHGHIPAAQCSDHIVLLWSRCPQLR